MKKLALFLITLLASPAVYAHDEATASNPVRSYISQQGFQATTAALEKALAKRGLILLAKIDHAAAANKAGLPLGPTMVFIFGNPKAGTPVMQADQRAGLDLPMKMLVMEDENATVKLVYRSPKALVDQWNLTPPPAPIAKMIDVMSALANEAAGR